MSPPRLDSILGNTFEHFFRAVITIIFDISWASIICFEILVLFASAFYHSNIRILELLNKIISKFFVAPSIHGVHHHVIDCDTNSNYSTIFSVWDKVFSTGNSLRLTAVDIISIGGEKDQPLLKLLIRPFSSRP